jgi:hypothetical protein
MKNVIFLLFFAANVLHAQKPGQKYSAIDKSVMDVVYFPNGAHRIHMSTTPEEKATRQAKIKITYSRPLAAGRKVFGDLVKYDTQWRFGANESTELVLYTAAKIGGTTLQAGRYTLYCTPSAEKWTLSVSPLVDGWGVYGFDFTKDLAKVTAPVTKTETPIEAFSIAMYEASPGIVHLKAGWENAEVEFPIELVK